MLYLARSSCVSIHYVSIHCISIHSQVALVQMVHRDVYKEINLNLKKQIISATICTGGFESVIRMSKVSNSNTIKL